MTTVGKSINRLKSEAGADSAVEALTAAATTAAVGAEGPRVFGIVLRRQPVAGVLLQAPITISTYSSTNHLQPLIA